MRRLRIAVIDGFGHGRFARFFGFPGQTQILILFDLTLPLVLFDSLLLKRELLELIFSHALNREFFSIIFLLICVREEPEHGLEEAQVVKDPAIIFIIVRKL